MWNVPLLQAGGGGQYMFFITLGLVFLIFYFLLIRPQKKEQKKLEALIANVKKGDKIVTIGGIHGIISLTKERTVVVKVDEGCKIEMSRNAIATVIQEPKEKVAKEEKDNSVQDEKDCGLGFFKKKKYEKKE